jgi:UDP-N-acetylglucosamine/UDP-N-acetylgalactosamine diphosphorylase
MIDFRNPDWKKIIERVYQNQQEHIFRFWNELSPESQQCLIDQISRIDFTLLADLINSMKLKTDAQVEVELSASVVTTLEDRKIMDARMLPLGEEALLKGELAAFLVAGGQGSRLGLSGPKGCYPITPVKRKSLFQLHAEKILARAKKYRANIPWYIMTSMDNHQDTIDFFCQHNYFGFNNSDVVFFSQDMLPAIDRNGKLLLDAKDHIFENPNGHGGTIKAIWDSGALQDMHRRKIKYLFYFQVDNVLIDICDPVFIGHHIYQGAEMSNKVVRKRHPEDRLGVVCRINGKDGVIEYSDLSPEKKYARLPDGRLEYAAGSIAIHIINTSFIEKENRNGFRLPYHIAEKSIACIDPSGQRVNPAEKNGVKFETFIFDALLDAEKVFTMETDWDQEFSAVKNSAGSESPATAKADLLRTYANWLEAADIIIPRNADQTPVFNLEISPAFALNADDVRRKRDLITEIGDGLYL